MDDMSPKELLKKFVNGDSVATLVGVGAFQTSNGLVPYAMATVFYTKFSDPRERESYAKCFEEMWEENSFDDGFDVVRNAPDEMVISSKARVHSGIVGKETYAVDSPAHFTEFKNSPDSLSAFFDMAKKNSYWVLHLETTKATYLFVVDYPGGKIVTKIRRSTPIEFIDGKGEEA